MALPQTFSSGEPNINEAAAQGPAKLQANNAVIRDFLGVPDGTPLTAAAFSITAAGVVAISQAGATVFADPTTAKGIATKGYVDTAVGAATGLNTRNTWTKSQVVATAILAFAASVATDASLSDNFTLTATGNFTLANPTNLVNGQTLSWIITQDGTGSRIITYDTLFKFAGGTRPALSTAGNAVDMLVAQYNGTILLCNLQKAFS